MWTSSRIAALFCLTTAVDCSSYPQILCEPGDEATLLSCVPISDFGLGPTLRWHWKSNQELKLQLVSQRYHVKLDFADGTSLDLPDIAPPASGIFTDSVLLPVNLSANRHLGGATLIFTPAETTEPSTPPIRIAVRLHATPSWVPDRAASVIGGTGMDIGAPRSLAIDAKRRVVTFSDIPDSRSSIGEVWVHRESINEFLQPGPFDINKGKPPMIVSVSSQFDRYKFISAMGSTSTALRMFQCQIGNNVVCEIVNITANDIAGLVDSAKYQDAMITNTEATDLLMAPHSPAPGAPKLLAALVPQQSGAVPQAPEVLDGMVLPEASTLRLAAGTLLPDRPAMFVVLQNTDGNRPGTVPQVLRRSGSTLLVEEDVAKALAVALDGVGPVGALAIADFNGDQLDDLVFAKVGIPELYYVENQTVDSKLPVFAKPALLADVSAVARPGLAFSKIDRIATGLIRNQTSDSLTGCMDIAIISEQTSTQVSQFPGGLLAAIINRPM